MPLGQAETVFQKAMQTFGFPNGGKIAVAVSGGADSMALCFLTHKFIQTFGGEMVALIVDHKLRSCSTEQAILTAGRLERKGITCRILTWEGDKPVSGVEQAAREARYRLLFDACRAEGCSALLLGHHKQDQAETFLIRQSKHSGPVGLAGMSAVRETDFGRILRPLLGASPADLRDFNRRQGVEWVEDETNLCLDFDRGRLRRTLTATQIEQAFQQTLFYGEKRRALEEEAAAFMTENVTESEMGWLLFPRQSFCALNRQTGLFCLGRFLRLIANREYAPRRDSLEMLWEKINSDHFLAVTLGGCKIAPSTKKQVLIWREENDLPPAVKIIGKDRFFWDRFLFSLDEALDFPVVVGPLKGGLTVKNGFPKRAFSVLPALFDNQGLFIVPHLGYKRTQTTCRVEFVRHAPLGRRAEWVNPIV